MAEMLSREEIDALVESVSSKAVKPPETDVPGMKKVRVYDFRRPDKFSGEHIRTLQMMHETFSRLTSAMLSARLQAPVSVRLISSDHLLYEEFIRSVASPTTMAVMDIYPLDGPVVFEIDPGMTFTIIDRLFGGQVRRQEFRRELTDIELYTMEGIFTGIAGNLMVTWSNVISIRPVLSCIETDPQFAQIVPPKDIVLLLTFELKTGEAEGLLNLCIPYITIEPVIERLTAKYWYSQGPGEREGPAAERLERAQYMRHIYFRDAVMPASPETIRRLKPGTVIPLKKDARPVPLYEFIRADMEA